MEPVLASQGPDASPWGVSGVGMEAPYSFFQQQSTCTALIQGLLTAGSHPIKHSLSFPELKMQHGKQDKCPKLNKGRL